MKIHLSIFDGPKLINMVFYHHHSAVPPEFEAITEFPIDYWNVLYDDHINVDKSIIKIYKDEIVASKEEDDNYLYAPFKVKGESYYLLLDPNFTYEHEFANTSFFMKMFENSGSFRINREWEIDELNEKNTVMFSPNNQFQEYH